MGVEVAHYLHPSLRGLSAVARRAKAEAKRRGNPLLRESKSGLLRFARNDNDTVVVHAREDQARMKQPCVYIMANRRNGTLYTGVTSNLPKRAYEHREGLVEGFSTKYACKVLVWYEVHETMADAIAREKQIKAGSRAKKLALIEAFNPEWKDLCETLG